MDKFLVYLYPIRPQFLDFIHWMVFDLFFYCVTLKTIYKMDLEFCIRDDWCKYWPTGELVHQAHSLSEFLGLWSKDWSSLKIEENKPVLGMGLSACTEWIWNFVQEIAGVSTDPQGSWSTKYILFLGFNWRRKIWFGHETVCHCWMHLELCTTNSWCK